MQRHNRIRKMKKENKLLKIKDKKVEALRLKVGKLREIIKELRKQLEQADKAHQRNKNKRPRMQGRNPLPKREVTTNSVGIQTDPEEITVEDAVAQHEQVILLETVDAEVQTYTLVSEGIAQSLEQDATIRRLEEELMQSQQSLIQNINELMTMAEHQASQSQEQSAIIGRPEE
jgi:hypothetical protein